MHSVWPNEENGHGQRFIELVRLAVEVVIHPTSKSTLFRLWEAEIRFRRDRDYSEMSVSAKTIIFAIRQKRAFPIE